MWDDVVGQFLEAAEIAKRCNGSLVMLAALVDSYPQAVRARIESELGGGIPYILLTKGDLESGRRNMQQGALTRPLALDDLVPNPFPERPRSRAEKPRRISIGWGVQMQE